LQVDALIQQCEVNCLPRRGPLHTTPSSSACISR
jgi:hypothetical protein